MKRFIIFLALLSFSGNVDARVVGSNSAAARQVATFFPNTETNNQMLGFSMFEKGIMLADTTTTCTYDSSFPVSGNVVLNGGTLIMLRDMEFKSPYNIGPGIIDGQGWCSLLFGACQSFPSTGYDKLITSSFFTTVGGVANSVDYSFDGKYILLARQSTTGNELQVFYVSDQGIAVVGGLDLGSHTNAVRWHPSSYYFALGKSASDAVEVYYFNPADGSITKTSGLPITTVNAVAWNPQGTKLAVGRASSTDILVYEIENGVLGTSYSATYSVATRVAQKNAISWDSTGNYVAVGLDSNATEPEIVVFCSTSTAVYKYTQAEVGATVYSVAWHPSFPCLAAGLSAGTDRLALYSFGEQARTLTSLSALAAVAGTVYRARWNATGTHLAATTATTTYAYDVNLFAFDPVLLRLNQSAGYRVGISYNDIAWAPDGLNLCAVGASNAMRVFTFTVAPVVFKNVKIYFSSNVNFLGPVIFQGACSIDGGGNTFSFGPNGSLAVASGSSLVIEDAYMDGIVANSIGCANNTSSLRLKNSEWNQDSKYTFSVGALSFQGDVLMSGNTMFEYSSGQESSILAFSELTFCPNFTFYYNPSLASKTLLGLAAQNSRLTLNGATLRIGSVGLQLDTGIMQVLRDSFVAIDTDSQSSGDKDITFGSGVSADDDIELYIGAGAVLTLQQGALNYKNVAASSLFLSNVSSVLSIQQGATLKLYQSMNLRAGVLTFGHGATLARALGKDITGAVQPLGRLFYADIA